MNPPGLPAEIIRLTTQNPFRERLVDAMGSSEMRSPLCGSRVIVDLNWDGAGRIVEAGMRVNACAFGQAAATLLARHLLGRDADELAAIRDDLAAWAAGERGEPDWPDIVHLRPDRLNQVRKASIQLAFKAAAAAIERAGRRQAAA